jgi:hypothetical protein
MNKPHILIPWNAAEGLTLKEASTAAGRSERTIRRWCIDKGIGRRVADGTWTVSKVALLMLLEGDDEALFSYLHGARGKYPPVAPYFERTELGHLLQLPEFSV